MGLGLGFVSVWVRYWGWYCCVRGSVGGISLANVIGRGVIPGIVIGSRLGIGESDVEHRAGCKRDAKTCGRS